MDKLNSPPVTQETQCGNKIPFPSYPEARRAADKSSDLYRRRINPYLCSFCGCWHIGGKRKWRDVMLMKFRKSLVYIDRDEPTNPNNP